MASAEKVSQNGLVPAAWWSYNEDRSVAVILNGEIYNFRKLRRDLERRGHSFPTKGDTEVIAHLYQEKGRDLVHELNGILRSLLARRYRSLGLLC